jgi:hypothetical protein
MNGLGAAVDVEPQLLDDRRLVQIRRLESHEAASAAIFGAFDLADLVAVTCLYPARPASPPAIVLEIDRRWQSIGLGRMLTSEALRCAREIGESVITVAYYSSDKVGTRWPPTVSGQRLFDLGEADMTITLDLDRTRSEDTER